MSIVCYVLRTSPALIAEVKDDHELLAGVTQHAAQAIWNAQFEATLARMAPAEADAMRKERDASLAQVRAMPDFAADFARLAAAQARASALAIPEAICLDKHWHILHFLLSGSSGLTGEPADTLLSGMELGQDAGYGPARLHEPDAARAYAEFLFVQDFSVLVANADLKAMHDAKIYAAPDAFDDILSHMLKEDFARLRDYVAHASEAGEGLIAWLS